VSTYAISAYHIGGFGEFGEFDIARIIGGPDSNIEHKTTETDSAYSRQHPPSHVTGHSASDAMCWQQDQSQ